MKWCKSSSSSPCSSRTWSLRSKYLATFMVITIAWWDSSTSGEHRKRQAIFAVSTMCSSAIMSIVAVKVSRWYAYFLLWSWSTLDRFSSYEATTRIETLTGSWVSARNALSDSMRISMIQKASSRKWTTCSNGCHSVPSLRTNWLRIVFFVCMEESVTLLLNLKTSTKYSGHCVWHWAISLIPCSRCAWTYSGAIQRPPTKSSACKRIPSEILNSKTISCATDLILLTSSSSRIRSAWLYDHIKTHSMLSTSSARTNWLRSPLVPITVARSRTMPVCFWFRKNSWFHQRLSNQWPRALRGNKSASRMKVRIQVFAERRHLPENDRTRQVNSDSDREKIIVR